MSQWGAYAMAQQGDTYKDILTFTILESRCASHKNR